MFSYQRHDSKYGMRCRLEFPCLYDIEEFIHSSSLAIYLAQSFYKMLNITVKRVLVYSVYSFKTNPYL